MSYLTHAVKRGLDHPATANFIKRASEEIEIPKWGSIIFTITLYSFIPALLLVDYMLKDVIATLAMVETPSAAITVSPSDEAAAPKEQKEGLLETGPTITLVHQKPITSSIRGTIRHLVSQAGRWSRWRGLKSFALYQICFNTIFSALFAMLRPVPGSMIISTSITGVALAQLHATWTHKVISMPTTKSFKERFVSRQDWKTLALPAALEPSAKIVCFYVAQGFMMLLGLTRAHNDDFTAYTSRDWAFLLFKFISVFVLVVLCALFINLPALVTLIRVEASILPEDQDTIVPFDRTFSGKVVPKILGGTGAVKFLDAWRSFNWEARRRLIKLYVKSFFIIMGLTLVVVHVLLFEVWVLMGPAVGKFLQQQRMANGAN